MKIYEKFRWLVWFVAVAGFAFSISLYLSEFESPAPADRLEKLSFAKDWLHKLDQKQIRAAWDMIDPICQRTVFGGDFEAWRKYLLATRWFPEANNRIEYIESEELNDMYVEISPGRSAWTTSFLLVDIKNPNDGPEDVTVITTTCGFLVVGYSYLMKTETEPLPSHHHKAAVISANRNKVP